MKRLIITIIFLCGSAFSQNTPTLGDMPDQGPALPATCNVGQVYFKTTATTGLNQCTSANTWTVVPLTGGGGSGTVTSVGLTQTGTALTITGSPVTVSGNLNIAFSATGIAAFLATPSSANFLAAITDETGSGVVVGNNGPTLIAPVLGTPASGVLTNATGYLENNLTGAGAAATITEGGATNSVTRAGIATAALTAPWVFQNTNSSNNNTSITLGVTAPGTSTGQTVLNVNGAATGGDLTDWGTGGTWTAGVLSGQTILASVLPSGAFQAKGSTAGFIDFPQGSTSAAVAPCNAATSICLQAPTSVTSQLRVMAGSPASGFSLWTNSSGTMTETIAATSGTLNSGFGLLGTLAINTVLASTVANVAGHFTNIQVVTSLGGTCTTLPQFNVFDGATNVGSAVTANAATQTKGTGNSTAQTLTFAAGDVIGIFISTAGGTCIANDFIVSAQYSIP